MYVMSFCASCSLPFFLINSVSSLQVCMFSGTPAFVSKSLISLIMYRPGIGGFGVCKLLAFGKSFYTFVNLY